MDKYFEQRLDELFFDGERTELRQLIVDQRNALEQIAYTVNWPQQQPAGAEQMKDYQVRIKQWMQAVAASALTNAGR